MPIDLTQIVEWTSCDTAMATIDSLGVVRGRGVPGSAVIRARALPLEDFITLTVDAVVGVSGPVQVESFGSRRIAIFPNPARGGEATVFFRAREANVEGRTAASTSVVIYDTAGRHVRSLVEMRRAEGDLREARWDGRDHRGKRVPPGHYLVQVQSAGEPPISERIVVLR